MGVWSAGPSLLDLLYAPHHQQAGKPEYGHVNTARLGGGDPPKLKPEEQECKASQRLMVLDS